jgi:hypothetical protein
MIEGTAETYSVFVRDWWRRPGPGEAAYQGRVPYPGAPRRTIARRMTYDEARAMCQEYNATHKPGWRSRKAEFERE